LKVGIQSGEHALEDLDQIRTLVMRERIHQSFELRE
jgi:hypothetical protein